MKGIVGCHTLPPIFSRPPSALTPRQTLEQKSAGGPLWRSLSPPPPTTVFHHLEWGSSGFGRRVTWWCNVPSSPSTVGIVADGSESRGKYERWSNHIWTPPSAWCVSLSDPKVLRDHWLYWYPLGINHLVAWLLPCLFFLNCKHGHPEAGDFKSCRYQKQPHCSSFFSVCSYRMTCTFELRRRCWVLLTVPCDWNQSVHNNGIIDHCPLCPSLSPLLSGFTSSRKWF